VERGSWSENGSRSATLSLNMKSSTRTFVFAAGVLSWSAKRKSNVFVFVSFSRGGPETRDAMYPTP
jgi:hypothetical protein